MNDERRPPKGTAPLVEAGRPNDSTTVSRAYDRCSDPASPTREALRAQLERRRLAEWRLPPLDTGRRDPLHRVADRRAPSDYSLTRAELRAEWSRLVAAGWSPSEVGRVLAARAEVAA